jgi:hypothetical protein
MARDGERHTQKLALEFEVLCARILQAAGYTIDREWRATEAPDATWRFDFVAARPARGQTEQRIIDVKWMPLSEATLRVAHNIASLYSPIRASGGIRRRTLILSAAISSASQLWIEGEYATDIWGRDQLRVLADDALRQELDAFLLRSDEWFAELRDKPAIVAAKPLRQVAREDAERRKERADAFATALASDPTELKANGAALCAELHALAPGKKTAYRYEQLIDRIFAFLFPADLLRTGPSTKRTEDGLNIYDLVFQIRNRSRFWTNLSRDLRSRVMVVECKNYSKRIEAMQVYTTERYLSPSALRSIALIVTRKPPRADAVQAASGALRESGKLMLILDDAAVCAMLHTRDTQLSSTSAEAEENDPAEVIDARLHQFLATLSR